MRFGVAAAAVAAIACAPIPEPAAQSAAPARRLRCDDPSIGQRGLGGAQMACAMAADARRSDEGLTTAKQAAKPDPFCQVWATMTGDDRYEFLEEEGHAWSDAYDLSREKRWCLTNARSVEMRASSIDVACAKGGEGNPRDSFETMVTRCRAVPDE